MKSQLYTHTHTQYKAMLCTEVQKQCFVQKYKIIKFPSKDEYIQNREYCNIKKVKNPALP